MIRLTLSPQPLYGQLVNAITLDKRIGRFTFRLISKMAFIIFAVNKRMSSPFAADHIPDMDSVDITT